MGTQVFRYPRYVCEETLSLDLSFLTTLKCAISCHHQPTTYGLIAMVSLAFQIQNVCKPQSSTKYSDFVHYDGSVEDNNYPAFASLYLEIPSTQQTVVNLRLSCHGFS